MASLIPSSNNFCSPVIKRELGNEFKYGDVILVPRSCYDHYGIYVNDNSVIHYSSLDSDISSNNTIIETNINLFQRDSKYVYKVVFPEEGSEFYKKLKKIINWWNSYNFYNPSETVKRARSRIGENKYSLFFNNCEHFAIWCKTGISDSSQVDNFLSALGNAYQIGKSTQVDPLIVKAISSTITPTLIKTTTNPITSTTVSTIVGTAAGTAAGIGTGIAVSGSTLTGIAAVAGGSALTAAAAPVALGVAAAVGVGAAVKGLWDWLSD